MKTKSDIVGALDDMILLKLNYEAWNNLPQDFAKDIVNFLIDEGMEIKKDE